MGGSTRRRSRSPPACGPVVKKRGYVSQELKVAGRGTTSNERKRRGRKEGKIQRTYSKGLVVGSGEGANEAVVGVAAGKLWKDRIVRKEGERKGGKATHRMRPRPDLVNKQRKDSDTGKGEEELAEGGSRVDLVHVGGPHRLDVLVFGDLRGGRGVSGVCEELEDEVEGRARRREDEREGKGEKGRKERTGSPNSRRSCMSCFHPRAGRS